MVSIAGYNALVDLPLGHDGEKGDDLLQISSYVLGLRDFISNCPTPMSIAIQGDWGTGKTSLMNLVADKLDHKKIHIVKFNTWQYSQFNMERDLAVSFLNYIVTVLNKEVPGGITHKLKSIVNKVSIINVSSISVMGVKFDLKDKENENKFDVDLASEIAILRDFFAKGVEHLLEKNGKEKMVIFIDDLDRLDPKIAVELLEVIKLFLDVKNCVFVLAIDYDVVTRGVSSKYGEDMSKEKSQSFFDKIIQLPFQMPVHRYNIEKFIQTTLGLNEASNEQISILVKLIKQSIGGNPRTIKRLVNSFQLIRGVISHDKATRGEEDGEDGMYYYLLLAVLC